MAKGTLTYTLRRIVFGDTFTGGELINPENKRIAYTIEDTDRGLDVGTSSSTVAHVKSQYPKLTAINAGTWTIEFTRNTSISSINYIDGGMGVGVVPVLNGNGWGGIRFHGGGSSRASAGCIILGTQLPNSDHIPSSKAVIESVNKEMVYYHLQGYNLQINIIRAKGAKLSSAANALGAFVGGNINDSGIGGGAVAKHNWPEFNVQSFPVMSDAGGNYTSEPLLLGIANHLRMEGGSTGAGSGTFTGEGDFPPGSLPIPNGFYPDKVLWYFISHAEGDVAVMWTTGKDSRTPVVAEGCDGYDYPGGVHSKSLLPPGYTIQRLGVSWTNNGRATAWAEGKQSGARWGWYSTKITPEHEYWRALMPVYRDAMIWAWNNVQGLMGIKDPAERLCEMHICNWGYHHNKTLKGPTVFGYKNRHRVASEACAGMQPFP